MIPRVKPAYVAAGVVALLLLIWLGSKCTTDRSDYDAERAAWETDRRILQHQIEIGRADNADLLERIRTDSVQAAPIIAQADSLQATVIRERAAKVAALDLLAARQRELSDSTEMSQIAAAAIQAARDARQEADTLSRTVAGLRGVVDQQMRNLAAVQGRLQATQASADSCAQLLDRAPVYKGDKFLGFIPLPSRTASLIIGGVLGATTVVLVSR